MIPDAIVGVIALGSKLYDRWKNGTPEEKAQAIAEAEAANTSADAAAAKTAAENVKLRGDSDAAIAAAERRANPLTAGAPAKPEFDTSDTDDKTDPGKVPHE